MGQVVICARVALQLTIREYNNWPVHQSTPAQAAATVARLLPPEHFTMLRFALHSLSVYLGLGNSASSWLQSVLEAAHFGHSFRRCFFFDYKANRGPYPRVTNRGVQNPPEVTSARVKKGKVNA